MILYYLPIRGKTVMRDTVGKDLKLVDSIRGGVSQRCRCCRRDCSPAADTADKPIENDACLIISQLVLRLCQSTSHTTHLPVLWVSLSLCQLALNVRLHGAQLLVALACVDTAVAIKGCQCFLWMWHVCGEM
jgi:hypothetical protein